MKRIFYTLAVVLFAATISFGQTTEPLYVVKITGEEKEVAIDASKDTEKIGGIDPATIESINVVKGEAAIKKYGDKGVNGVVVIEIYKKHFDKLPKAIQQKFNG